MLVIIFWLAIVISAAITTFMSFLIENINVGDIFALVMFFFASGYILVEIFKWPLGKRKIDNSGRIASRVFGDAEDTWWWPTMFARESIISAKKGEKPRLFGAFIISIAFLGLSILAFFVK